MLLIVHLIGLMLIIIIILAILLVPRPLRLKDGGSVEYKAILYTVTKIHQLSLDVDSVKPYIDGLEVKIFGMTVYRETNIEGTIKFRDICSK